MKKELKPLFIDPSGGFAGDMFIASLVSAGADFGTLRERMEFAGNMLGNTLIAHKRLTDGSERLIISLVSRLRSLEGNKAKKIIRETFEKFGTGDYYRAFGFRILDILLMSESRAHREHPQLNKMSNHSANSDHYSAHLHEAQDIVIDIVGAVSGLESLGLDIDCRLLQPVSAGAGKVKFSHGSLDVPSPATAIIFKEYLIPWNKGPVETEMCTPTGAAILAALWARSAKFKPDQEDMVSGSSRGMKDLQVEPLRIYFRS